MAFRVKWYCVLQVLYFLFISKVLIPDTSELENPKYDLATRIISADNKEIGKAFRYNREWLQFEEINPHIIDALISTEDERYFDHSGNRCTKYLEKRSHLWGSAVVQVPLHNNWQSFSLRKDLPS